MINFKSAETKTDAGYKKCLYMEESAFSKAGAAYAGRLDIAILS